MRRFLWPIAGVLVLAGIGWWVWKGYGPGAQGPEYRLAKV